MSILRVAARRATPMVARAGRQQARWASSGSTSGPGHYDPFAINPNNKKQIYLYNFVLFGALSTPIFAVRYQLNKYKEDKRSFG